MTQVPEEAREAMEIYSPVFKVDGQACYLPQMMAPPPPRQRQMGQTVLYLLLVVTLCGVIVEACFIYKLYNTIVMADTSTTPKHQQGESDATANSYRTDVKPPKPSAHLTAGTVHLPREDGLMTWTSTGGDAFTQEMDYIQGKLFVKREGFYFIYSKVFFSEPSLAAFTHTVLRSSPYSPNNELELMRTFRFHDTGNRRGGMLNSYLGGVYLLHEGDAIFVKVHNHTKLLRQVSADNFFGTFML